MIKHLYWIWLILAGLPLLIYPFLLLANIMSLAAETPREPIPFALRLCSLGFLLSSTFYPLAYGGCIVKIITLVVAAEHKQALRWSFVPLLYLAIVAMFFCGWMLTSQ